MSEMWLRASCWMSNGRWMDLTDKVLWHERTIYDSWIGKDNYSAGIYIYI